MVWNTEQSPLYQSVEKFNGGSCQKQEAEESDRESSCEKPEPPPELHDRSRCKPDQQPRSEYRSSSSYSGNLIQRITSDRDFMLIAAMILLLWHEKADMKLIAALAFVLLA